MVLRQLPPADLPMVLDLATDPYLDGPAPGPRGARLQRHAEHARFTREGLLRSYQAIGGRRRDMLLYASVRLG